MILQIHKFLYLFLHLRNITTNFYINLFLQIIAFFNLDLFCINIQTLINMIRYALILICCLDYSLFLFKFFANWQYYSKMKKNDKFYMNLFYCFFLDCLTRFMILRHSLFWLNSLKLQCK